MHVLVRSVGIGAYDPSLLKGQMNLRALSEEGDAARPGGQAELSRHAREIFAERW